MRRLQPSRSTKHIGYHRNCGGTVTITRQHKGYEYARCSACRTNVVSDDILDQQPDFRVQQSKGVKRRIPKYDYNNWNDVKE